MCLSPPKYVCQARALLLTRFQDAPKSLEEAIEITEKYSVLTDKDRRQLAKAKEDAACTKRLNDILQTAVSTGAIDRGFASVLLSVRNQIRSPKEVRAWSTHADTRTHTYAPLIVVLWRARMHVCMYSNKYNIDI